MKKFEEMGKVNLAPEGEASCMNKERRQHPGSSQGGPKWMMIFHQGEECGQVRGHVQQTKQDIEQDKFQNGNHFDELEEE